MGQQSNYKHHCCAQRCNHATSPAILPFALVDRWEKCATENEDLIVRARKIKGQNFQLPSACRPMRGKDATRSPCLPCVLTLSGSRHRKGNWDLEGRDSEGR